MNVKLATEADSTSIAQLHVQYINTGFLSKLGFSFLKLMYQSMINSNNAFCIKGVENKNIVGYVSGAVNVSGFYKEFIKKSFFKATVILVRKFPDPKFTKNIFETLFYPLKKRKNLPTAELLSIVVINKYQGKGISKILFKELVKEFQRRGIKQFKVIVGSKLLAAHRFYEKMGATLCSEIEIHKGDKSIIYVWLGEPL